MLTEFFDRIIRALTPRPALRYPAIPQATNSPVLPGQFFKSPSPSLNSLPPALSYTPGVNSAPILSFPSPFAPQTTSGALPAFSNLPRVAPPDSPFLNTFAGYGGSGSPFLVFPSLADPTPPTTSRLPPPSFAFGPAGDSEKMGELKQPTASPSTAASASTAAASPQITTSPPTTATAPPLTAAAPPLTTTTSHSTITPHAAAESDEKQSSAPEISYFKLHISHMTLLKKQIKHLDLLNRKQGCEGKLDKMIVEYAKIIKDAKTAAAIAGIIRDDPQPTEKRKSRPSISFDEGEIRTSPVYKKTKSKPAPTTTLKHRRGNAGKRKPTAEAQATLFSCLGKRNRTNTETPSEDEEMPQRPFKRPRVRIFQEGDPLGKYLGDPDSDDEDSDSDSDSFKSVASKSETTPTNSNAAEATYPSAATPANTKAAEATINGAAFPTTAPVPVHQPPTSPISQAKHTADDTPVTDKSAKKQKQEPTLVGASSSSADHLFAIRPSLPGKHIVDDEAGNEKSAKKQKKSTPTASTSNNNTTNASPSASTPTPMAPPTIPQSPIKRSASGADVSQLNIKRNKKNNEN